MARNTTSYVSMVVDRADKSAFSLPHICTNIKQQRGHGMKVHLVGLPHHLGSHHVHLFSMTVNHNNGANHIVEVIHVLLNDLARERPLPRRLIIQL